VLAAGTLVAAVARWLRAAPAGPGEAAVMRWYVLSVFVIGLFLFASRLPPFERDCSPPGAIVPAVYNVCPRTPLMQAVLRLVTGVDLH
jgi:hypothetical protein